MRKAKNKLKEFSLDNVQKYPGLKSSIARFLAKEAKRPLIPNNNNDSHPLAFPANAEGKKKQKKMS